MPACKDPEKEKIRREKISKAFSGEKHPNFGKHPSQATRDKQSKTRIGKYAGKNHPMFGTKRPNHSERMKGKGNPNWKEMIHKICPTCKENFDVIPSHKDQECCKKKCTAKLYSGSKNHQYIDGRSLEYYPAEFSDKLRESIRRRDGYRCQKCGLPEIGEINGRILPIHHIDGDRHNNRHDNLITLCIKCNNGKVRKNPEKWIKYFQKKLAIGYQQKQLCLIKL